MDPITHCLVGGILAKSFKTSRRRFWIMMFLGDAPDLDVLFGGLGPWAFWLQHRGITHSIVGVVIQAVAYAWIFAKYDQGAFKERVALYSLPLIFHLVCDFLTSFGVPLFSPFSFQEFSANIVPAVTLIPLVFMLAGLIYLSGKKKEGWGAVQPIWLGWAVYVFISLSGKAYALKLVGPVEGTTEVVASRINPLEWTAMVRKNSGYGYQPYTIDAWNGKTTLQPAVLTAADSFAIQASLKSAEAKHVVDTLRWPVARQVATADGYTVEWGRIIFSARGLIRGEVIVTETKDGTITNVQRVCDFWNSTTTQ